MTTQQQVDFRQLLQKAYDALNARDIDAVLEVMHPQVRWANGMEGGFVTGHAGIRTYWLEQWQYIDPHLEAVAFDSTDSNFVAVEVHQIIRDLLGNIISIKNVQHLYQLEEGCILSMRVSPAFLA